MEEDWMPPFFSEPDIPKEQLVPFVPSSYLTAEKVVELLKINENDKLIDVGSGDGRILFKAVEMTNCKGVGIDINQSLIDECNKKVKKKNLEDKLKFLVDDFSKDDFNFYDCNCICFYLVPKILKIIENKIKTYIREDKNRRVVSIRFPFRNLIPTYIDETMKLYYYDINSKDGNFGDDNYLNILPAF
jgi:SAM-dependent methyltransferase